MELGITGHKTRGYEVIKILELLGGHNRLKLEGSDDKFFYYITEDDYKDIGHSYIGPEEFLKGYEIYTFDEFWKAFPYKVGDKVNVWVNHEHFSGPRAELEEAEIKSMRWNCGRCEVAYRMKDQTGEFYKSDIKGKVDDGSNKQSECEQCGRVFGSVKCFDVDCPSNIPNYVKDYTEIDKQCIDEVHKRYSEITHVCLTGRGYTLPDGFHLVDENGKSIDAKEIKLVKNAPTYPKDYIECCEVLHCAYEQGITVRGVTEKEAELFRIFIVLKRCRDAYWKIAGEQMGLGKPWEPEFGDLSVKLEFIKINKGSFTHSSELLVFPTVEMRDAFRENFKDLIELCKELL